jgi:hypothetical protein
MIPGGLGTTHTKVSVLQEESASFLSYYHPCEREVLH